MAKLPAELVALRDMAAEVEWTFAKTRAHIPHHYIVKGKVSDELFEGLREAILRYGRTMHFGPYLGRYLFIQDGYKYWLGANRDLLLSTIINRDSVLDPKDWGKSPADAR